MSDKENVQSLVRPYVAVKANIYSGPNKGFEASPSAWNRIFTIKREGLIRRLEPTIDWWAFRTPCQLSLLHPKFYIWHPRSKLIDLVDSSALYGSLSFERYNTYEISSWPRYPLIDGFKVAFFHKCRTSFQDLDHRSRIRALHDDPLFTSIQAHAIRVQR